MNTRKVKRREASAKDWRLARSIADEIKKVAYLGAAGPYLLLGDKAQTVVGGGIMVAIAVVWFIMCQAIAHAMIAAANAGENDDERA